MATAARTLSSLFWGSIGAGLSIQTFLALNPTRVVNFVQDRVVEDDKEHLEKWQTKFRHILQSVGVRNADKVKLIETENFGPTTVGCDLPLLSSSTKYEAVVFVPRALLRSADFSEEELTEERRKELLETNGTLFPTEREMDYILGHEAAHLAKNHSLKSSAVGLTSLSLSFGFLKFVSGKGVPRLATTSSMILRRSFVSLAATAVVVGVVSVLQEREADITSASRLNCAHEATLLAEKKRQQNLWMREQAGGSFLRSWVSAHGNDLLEWEHPSVTWQKSYLQKLERDQRARVSASSSSTKLI